MWPHFKITAVIPAYQEEDRIGATIFALCGIPAITEILVVDDGSTDGTAVAAKAAGAKVIRQPVNRGKAEALARGVREAQGDLLCFADADLGSSAREFAKLIEPVAAGSADMTVATFPPAQKRGGFGLVKGLARLGIRTLSGYSPAAPLSGQRVLRREVWEKAAGDISGFGVEVGLTVECARHGFVIEEVPVNMTHRETGRDFNGFKHRGRQFVEISRTLWRLWRKGGEKA